MLKLLYNMYGLSIVHFLQLHISSMREELLTKEKEFDDYKGKMTEKEEKIKQLTEAVRSQKENQLRAADDAHSTADTIQNSDELAGIVIYVAKLIAELDDANREKHQMVLKSEIASQESKRLKESIRKLKSKIVSSGSNIHYIILYP